MSPPPLKPLRPQPSIREEKPTRHVHKGRLQLDVTMVGGENAQNLAGILGSIATKLAVIEAQGARIMAKVDEFKAELESINTTTNEIAADIADLVSRTQGGLSEAEAVEVGAKLAELKARLEAVASTHTVPTP